MSYKILTVNPGSTSTKVALFIDQKEVFKKNIKHSAEEIAKFERISDQLPFRMDVIMKELEQDNVDLNGLNAVMGRGGLLHPLASGVYEVNEAMRRDLNNSPFGEHASNLGGLIAFNIASKSGSITGV